MEKLGAQIKPPKQTSKTHFFQNYFLIFPHIRCNFEAYDRFLTLILQWQCKP